MAYLILIRHGESQWNAKGLWTGLTDVSLTEKGKEEAVKAGNAISDITIDQVYTSPLKRAKETYEEIKKVLKLDVPTTENVALNERDYGDLTGKNKWEMKEKYGEEQFLKWRRSWDSPIPNGETLKDVCARVLPYYESNILPLLKQGKNVLVVAHGNSLRAIIKHVEGISEKEIPKLEFGTGSIYLYQFDEKGDMLDKQVRAKNTNVA